MLAMENSSRYNRAQAHSSLKQRRSGYEPSDTETEWQESPWLDLKKDDNQRDRMDGVVVTEQLNAAVGPTRNITPLSRSQRYSLKPDYDFSSPVKASKTSPIPRNKSLSPYKPRTDDGNGVSPKLGSHLQRNISPLVVPEHRRHISPYETRKDEPNVENNQLRGSNRKRNQKTPPKFMDAEENRPNLQTLETSRLSEWPNHSHRSMSAPKLRAREKEQLISTVSTGQRGDQSPLPLAGSLIQKQRESAYARAPSGEVSEMIPDRKLSKVTISDVLFTESTDTIISDVLFTESTDTIPAGDIFFSRDVTALHENIVPKNIRSEGSFIPKPKAVSQRNSNAQQRSRGITAFDQNTQVAALNTIPSQRNLRSSSSVSGQSGSKSTHQSNQTYGSGMMSENFRKFTANRQRSQMDMLFSCVRKGACRKSKSPETREIDEASFIEKAFVVENLRQFWADKHQPDSLSGFICHKQQALDLKQLISHNNCPHILFRGPSGSGKKALSMALLNEIFGASIWNETQAMPVAVSVTSSPHHVELNLKSVSNNARYALMALVKEITSNVPTLEFSDATLKENYKVMVLHKVDKLADNVQHLIKWIMDCYTDGCKLILCCEDDLDLLPSIKSRCELITVDAPVTHEIMEVLIQIARKENFDLPMSFAAKIATKSKQNLRNAIMALEACKAHNYPFVDEQPIPLGWEEVLVDLAEEILANPSPKMLFFTRGIFQKLLLDFVHPKLILQKLVEQFLKGVEASLKRELYYWHAYYDKRLPTGTGALLKLEEFVAKFMSIYRKSFNGGRRLPYR
ncbi:uncharacterized protein LOC131237953 isoform X2 [Magnolia sinica]|uniref:uncharacterized protein LOC131237953 isoform X2 n=1 Tax=Magnolia sinica TaxID=86752 RepID=UPI00265A23F6|nr:uncharacterized protein LOC131237953 isoform X2 [Magnolia sinica]